MSMNLSGEIYRKYADARSRPSPLWRDVLRAFWVGGFICTLGQVLHDAFLALGTTEEYAGLGAAATLVFLSALFTVCGWFVPLAKYAGAGTLVPITGFANAVVSPAIDAKAEGMIPGVGTKIFSVAGPVLLYGSFAGFVYGILYYFFG